MTLTTLDGRYVLEDAIGHGGMADVYRGTDLRLDRPVAVKVLRDVAGSCSSRHRFTTESHALTRLDHPGLVSVYDAGVDPVDRPYLVMELVDGSTLAEHCTAALPPERVADLGVQVADALAYAHAAGIIHRDVKPANILLGQDGRTRLADFGIARILGESTRLTGTGETVGTAAYLAPEQLRGPEVSAAADVYALGLVLLEALTGSRVYTGPPVEAALARLSGPTPIPDTVPRSWAGLLRGMTAIQPAARPTAEEARAYLQQLTHVSEAAALNTSEAVLDAAALGTPAGDERGHRRTARALPATVGMIMIVGIAALASPLAHHTARSPSLGPPAHEAGTSEAPQQSAANPGKPHRPANTPQTSPATAQAADSTTAPSPSAVPVGKHAAHTPGATAPALARPGSTTGPPRWAAAHGHAGKVRKHRHGRPPWAGP